MKTLDCENIKAVFEQQFFDSHNVQLISGASEPLYRAARNNREINQLFFTRDYAASALHEIAHWCIAGEERLKSDDWGYWYIPDGRNQSQQQAFEQVEAKTQALEWIFCKAAGLKFHISLDNLNGETGDSDSFRENIKSQVQKYCECGLPLRGKKFFHALQTQSGLRFELAPSLFD